MHRENNIALSIVIPVFNEINFLSKLFEHIKHYFNNKKTEIIFVDDGSNDGSSEILNELKDKKDYHFFFNL